MRLTEIILLGVLAQRFGTRIEWDAKAGRITNHPELDAFVREPAGNSVICTRPPVRCWISCAQFVAARYCTCVGGKKML